MPTLLLRLGFALLVFGLLAWIAELRPRLAAACAPMGRKSCMSTWAIWC